MPSTLAERLEEQRLPPFRLKLEARQLHFKRPLSTSRGMMTQQQVYFIYCQHAKGQGVGEVCAIPQLSPELGQDFLAQIQAACHKIESQGYLARGDFEEQSSIRFGMEGALLSSLTPYPWGVPEGAIRKHHLIWAGGRESIFAQMEQGAKAGATCFKMRVGVLPWQEECDLLREVRCRYPQQEIRVDANGSFDKQNALSKLQRLSQIGVASIEQPLPVGLWAAMAELIVQSPLPIALDEELIACHSRSAREHMLDTLRPHALVIKPSLHGGLQAAEDYLQLCNERGISCWLNSYLESNIALDLLTQWALAHMPHSLHGLGTGQLYRDNVNPHHLMGTL